MELFLIQIAYKNNLELFIKNLYYGPMMIAAVNGKYFENLLLNHILVSILVILILFVIKISDKIWCNFMIGITARILSMLLYALMKALMIWRRLWYLSLMPYPIKMYHNINLIYILQKNKLESLSLCNQSKIKLLWNFSLSFNI